MHTPTGLSLRQPGHGDRWPGSAPCVRAAEELVDAGRGARRGWSASTASAELQRSRPARACRGAGRRGARAYGEGLERSLGSAGADDGTASSTDDGVIASLLLIHGLYPVRSRRGSGGARQRAAVHGVARRRRRAPRPRGRRRPPAAGGQLQRLPGLRVDARARHQAGARRGRARPGRGRGRGRGEGRAEPPSAATPRRWAPARRPRAGPAWVDARRASPTLADGSAAAEVAGGRAAGRHVGGTLLAYRNALRGLRRAARGGRAGRRLLACPACERRFDLPLAGRSRRRRRAPARPRAAAARRRRGVRVALAADATRRPGGPGGRAALRRPGRRPAPARPLRRTASGAGRGDGERCELCGIAIPRTTATCCTSRSGGSSAPARPAARCAPATPTTARRARAGCGWRLRPPRRAVGALPDPDRARVLPALERGGQRRRAVPEPGRARPRASSTSRPGTRSWPRTPCSSELEADVEALIVNRLGDPPQLRDRADRRVLPAGRADQGCNWEGISGGDAVERRVAGFFGELREGRRDVSAAGDVRRRTEAGARDAAQEFEVLGAAAEPFAAAPTLASPLRVTEPDGARSTRSR